MDSLLLTGTSGKIYEFKVRRASEPWALDDGLFAFAAIRGVSVSVTRIIFIGQTDKYRAAPISTQQDLWAEASGLGATSVLTRSIILDAQKSAEELDLVTAYRSRLARRL